MRQPRIKKHQWITIGGKTDSSQPKGAEKALFFSYKCFCNVAGELQTLGKTCWYGKVCSQAARLDFMVELQNIIGWQALPAAYRGLQKQTEKLNKMFAMANLYLADKRGLLTRFGLPPADI